MNQDERLAMNIWSLRKAYREKQSDLGEAVDTADGGITQQAISKIEHGKGKVTRETLDKLAEHFMVSTEELLNDDFSGVLRINPDIEKMRASFRVIFPVVSTDASLKDEFFRKGVEAHEALYNCLSTAYPNGDQFNTLYDVAIEAYSEVGEAAEEDACANILALTFLLFSSISSVLDMMAYSSKAAPIKLLCGIDPGFKHVVEQSRRKVEDDPSMERERRAVVREIKNGEIGKTITELITRLKESSRLSYLADYYLALRFFYDLVSNGLPVIFNRRIGLEMLSAFEDLGNPAAIQFTRLCIESWRPENA